MKYKYIRIKYIIPSLLIIALLIVLGVYFLGGLKASSVSFDNIEWDSEGFTDFNGIEKSEINEKRIVGENSKYVMIMDESTTIVTIYEKKSGWSASDPTNSKTAKELYSSAQANGDAEAMSNVSLEYYNKNGKTTTLSSFAKSVQYENVTTGGKERYYKIRYGEDSNWNSYVDVLYSIGDFSPIVIPDKYDMYDFEQMFVGNTVLRMQRESDITTKTTIYDYDGSGNLVPTTEEGVEWKHQNALYCFDNEAALYILENGFGLLEFVSNDTSVANVKYTNKNVTAEERQAILNSKNGYWDVSDVLDENGKLKMKAGVDYNTSADAENKSPVVLNPFLNQTFYDVKIFGMNSYEPRDYQEDGAYTTTNWKTRNLDAYERTLKFKSANAILTKQAIYNYLYVGAFTQEEIGQDEEGNAIYQLNYNKHQYTLTNSKFKEMNVYYDYDQDGKITVDEYYQYGGYQLQDENGNFVYETSENGIVRPKQMGLQTEDAVAQNEKYNFDEASSTIAFDICVRFTLTSDGMEVTIINESIREGVGSENTSEDIPTYLKHDNVISKIQFCKYATVNSSDTSNGEIILPDGSGAVIKFNSEKSEQYASIYPEKRIYGDDMAINKAERGNISEKMMLPMYGFIDSTDRKGVVAIVTQGAAQTSISADFLRDASKGGMMKYNYAHFTTYYRDSEKVKVTSNTEYTKVSEAFYQGDVTYKYIFLSTEQPSTYVDVANIYRNYLLSKYPDLADNVDQTTVSTPTITFLGAYEKKTFKLGFVTDDEYSLTTFDQAAQIVKELNDNGISNMNVSYRSWTKDEINQKTTADVSVSKVIGGKKDMKEFSSYLKGLGFSFFPEYKVANGVGYDFAFGNLKYSSKSISGSYSSSIEYVLSTGLEDAEGGKGNFISPIYYTSLAEKFLANYQKLDVSGIYLSDLGNKSVADYSRGNQVYSATATLYQRDALKTFKGEEGAATNLVMLNAPYDYAFSYTDVATVIPVQCTLYGAVNYSIPLYQLVVSGLFDYSSKPVNYQNDYPVRWNLMKAIETGSNIAFVLCAEDTSELLNTRYTEYYNSYYTNWKENIIYMNNLLDSTGIYESRLVSHEYLTDNVVKVGYENGLTIIINYDSEPYQDSSTGYGVRSNWFAIIEEGE